MSDDNRELYRPYMPDEKRQQLQEAVRRAEAKTRIEEIRKTLNTTTPKGPGDDN